MPELKQNLARLPDHRGRHIVSRVREHADRAFSRAAGAPLIENNHVRLLRDATENYPAWHEAIRTARRHVHFENYILADDAIGQEFARALIESAQRGVHVRLIYDWLGVFGKASRRFWQQLRTGGVEVRCFNPPRFDSPLGWLSRDHRKVLTVDGEVGFISGLCVGEKWAGNAAKRIEPWRDTGVEIRGPAVADIENAFATVWGMLGAPIPEEELSQRTTPAPAGNVSLRIVASEPAESSTFRLDQLVVAFARKSVWLTDAYYLGTPTYVQALITAARDGVDVRLLLPNATDIPLLQPLSRVGYRPLLNAGVRIFEWNGSMLHAKTAVVDARWARVGSTNLNISSWLGNCEMDAVIEDEAFAHEMEEMYRQDLRNATEVVLNEHRRVRPTKAQPPAPTRRAGKGKAGRAAAGAVRIGHALGAAITDRRVIEPMESRLIVVIGLALAALAALFAMYPRALAYPAVALCSWLAIAMLVRGWKARRSRAESNNT